MKLLAHVHGFPPRHGAGAEWMLHHLLAAMVKRGHSVEVIAVPHADDGALEGVCVHADVDKYLAACLWDECDVAVTHLDRTGEAISLAIQHGKPIVHLVHNGSQLAYWKVSKFTCQMAVFNSEWIRASSRWSGPATVVRPPVDPERYRVEPGEKVTLVNVSPEKGSNLFWKLAAEMPEHEFLAVAGAYGRQSRPRSDLPNVEWMGNQADIRKAYRKTRVLLMPSLYESWGRCAMEAAVSGIPTIAAPCDGLRESLGSAGTFIAPNVEAWAQAIRRLDSPEVYESASRAVLARSLSLPPSVEYDAFEAALEEAVEGPPATEPPQKLWNGPLPRRF